MPFVIEGQIREQSVLEKFLKIKFFNRKSLWKNRKLLFFHSDEPQIEFTWHIANVKNIRSECA